MRKGASAEGRANSLKSRCRGSSRSTLPCFLLVRDSQFPCSGNCFPEVGRSVTLIWPVSIAPGAGLPSPARGYSSSARQQRLSSRHPDSFAQRLQEGVAIDVMFPACVVHGAEACDRASDTSHPENGKDADVAGQSFMTYTRSSKPIGISHFPAPAASEATAAHGPASSCLGEREVKGLAPPASPKERQNPRLSSKIHRCEPAGAARQNKILTKMPRI